MARRAVDMLNGTKLGNHAISLQLRMMENEDEDAPRSAQSNDNGPVLQLAEDRSAQAPGLSGMWGTNGRAS
jgi:hypothetical protein